MFDDTFTRITAKLERAARNGERAHLTTDEARALYASEAGRLIVLAARDELVAQRCAPSARRGQERRRNQSAQNDQPLTDGQQDLVAEAERRRAWAAADSIKGRRRRQPIER